MGILDIFKKKNNNTYTNTSHQQQETNLPFRPDLKVTPDGYWQLDCYDENADFKNFYDTTRLIINPNPTLICNKWVYNCMVSWYGRDNISFFNQNTGEYETSGSTDYSNIFAQIDLNLLQTDEDYYNCFMKDLLNKKRVEKYLNYGLQENPDIPCGEYIGGIARTSNGYYKNGFSLDIGNACHYSPLMLHKRQLHRETIELQKKKTIQAKREQIARLQNDINSMQDSQR